MNYYPHHIGDYQLATGHLSEREDLAYRRMLDCYYRDEKPFPDDASRVARLIRMPDAVAEVQTVLNEFFTPTDKGWKQKRADTEIREFRKKSEIARKNGKKGGRPPARKASTGAGENPVGFSSLSKTNPGQTGSKTNQNHNQNQNQNQKEKQSLGASGKTRPQPAARGSRMDIDSLPDEWQKFCETERPDLDPCRTFENFSDYWRAKPGKDGRKTDWLATWRNWCRNERSAARRVAGRSASRADEINEHNASFLRDLQADDGAIDVEAREINPMEVTWQPEKA